MAIDLEVKYCAMKTNIYTFICAIISILLCISMSGCSNAINEKDVYAASQNSYSDYKLFRDNGEFVIILNNLDSYLGNNQECASATIDFDNMKDFKDTVTKGLLTAAEKSIMAGFKKNSDGAIITCDFNNLYVPIVPDNFEVGGVSWEGSNYGFSLLSDDGAFGSFIYLPEDTYNNIFQSEYSNFFDRDLITVTKSEILEDGKEETFYTTRSGQFKKICYSLTDGEKTIVVDKAFWLQIDNSNYDLSAFGIETSSTVPNDIHLYCISEEGFCYISLFKLNEDPTDEWLANFGLQKYVDTDNTVKSE